MPMLFDPASPASSAPVPSKVNKESWRLAVKVLDVLDRYRLPVPPNTHDRTDEGVINFLPLIYARIKAKEPIRMVLPAFPFKSPNKQHKVLGTLPDKGEEFSLAHLDGICRAIGDVYDHGATICIASDGIVYNDILGVPEEEVWNYGQALRKMAVEKGFTQIEFTRLRHLMKTGTPEPTNEAEYAQQAPLVRERMVETYTPENYDINEQIASEEDICTTYRGYIKFLQKDLAHLNNGQSKSQVKKRNEAVAKKMIARGKAFAETLEKSFPDYVRLSIHPSTGAKKFSVSLFPNRGFSMTPWHSSPYFALDGVSQNLHKDFFEQAEDTEIVQKDGRPWMFRQKSELYNWSIDVSFEPVYPCGLLIKSETNTPLTEVDMSKVRKLAELNSPVILRGFADTTDRDLYVKKAHEMGEPTPWKFGLVLEVKDKGSETGGLNNVLSEEPMPMHFDGLFKTAKKIVNGQERLVSQYPRFQFFTVVTPSPRDTGFTLFSSSKAFFRNLPDSITVEDLSKLTWSVETSSFDKTRIEGQPLVVPHPTLGYPCLRYHEPWPQSKTRFDATYVKIEDQEDQSLLDIIDEGLYDRRVCYWHIWEEGDMIISDNVGMMHTRSTFRSGADRELWRIHVD